MEPLAQALDDTRQAYRNLAREAKAGDYVTVTAPLGEMRGVAIGLQGWDFLERVQPWWGDATLVLQAHPGGSTILPATDKENQGESLRLATDDPWAGRIHFRGFKIYGSGSNLLSCGAPTSERKPLKDVRLIDCELVEHPLATSSQHRTNRVVSTYQTSIQLIGGSAHFPNSKEHILYPRNSCGPVRVIRFKVTGCGGNPFQFVERPDEGPQTKGLQIDIEDSWFENYQRDPGRAGGAITIAGGQAEISIKRTVLKDIDGLSYAAIVIWDGERYYTLDGTPILKDEHEARDKTNPTGEYANYTATIQKNVIVHAGSNRDVVSLSSLRAALVTGNEFRFAGSAIALDALDRGDHGYRKNLAGVGTMLLDDNNTMTSKQLRAIGVPQAEAESNPIVRLRGKTIGVASSTLGIANGEFIL